MTAFAKTYFSPGERVPAGLLVSSYLFGTVMLGFGLVDGFVYLTALHLVFTTVLLAWTHRPKPSARLYLWLAACFTVGWLAEYVGVHGGWLFGEYVYGDVLGPKVAGIPIVIGVNWILVVYAVCGSLNFLDARVPRVAKALVGAAALVALDALIEPVAIRLDYWTWAQGDPPLQNFVGWFGVGLLQTALFYLLIPYTHNRLSPVLLALQLVFFAFLSITL